MKFFDWLFASNFHPQISKDWILSLLGIDFINIFGHCLASKDGVVNVELTNFALRSDLRMSKLLIPTSCSVQNCCMVIDEWQSPLAPPSTTSYLLPSLAITIESFLWPNPFTYSQLPSPSLFYTYGSTGQGLNPTIGASAKLHQSRIGGDRDGFLGEVTGPLWHISNYIYNILYLFDYLLLSYHIYICNIYIYINIYICKKWIYKYLYIYR